MKNLYKIEDELYIISDTENINENDYIVTTDNRLVQVSYLLSKDLEGASKVILTTNKLLIKDGVQAIDDEFLEWFVKNPSCEEVEIRKEYITPLGDIVETCYDNERLNYKIIIPKEKPKEREMFLMNANETVDTRSIVEKMKPLQEQWQKEMDNALNTKQETLEVAKKNFAHAHKKEGDMAYEFGRDMYSFEKGAKWQSERSYSEEELQQKIDAHLEVAKDLWLSAIKEQKRMYSEEEVVNILIKAYEDIGKRKIPNQVVLASWFKQFKKK